MPVLVSLTILIGLVSLLNLLLMLGLIKRVQEHSARLAVAGAGEPAAMLDVGERIDEFTTTTVDGEQVTRDLLPTGTLVAFFDPQCEICHEHLPSFAAEARRLPAGRHQALVVVRDGEDVDEMVLPLAPVARVVVERRRGPVARAFHVKATPAFCRLGADQVILAHRYEADAPAAPASV
jgi:hypothetical protein